MEQLERDLVRARRPQAGAGELALRLENELLQLDREWREKQEGLATMEERRRRRLKAASSLLFLVLALAGIAMLFVGTTVAGFVSFAASIVGWILAGLQEGRHARLMRLYEADRRRVDRMLGIVRASMAGAGGAKRARIADEEGEAQMQLEAEATEEVEAELRGR
jgi:hypothetical protein